MVSLTFVSSLDKIPHTVITNHATGQNQNWRCKKSQIWLFSSKWSNFAGMKYNSLVYFCTWNQLLGWLEIQIAAMRNFFEHKQHHHFYRHFSACGLHFEDMNRHFVLVCCDGRRHDGLVWFGLPDRRVHWVDSRTWSGDCTGSTCVLPFRTKREKDKSINKSKHV